MPMPWLENALKRLPGIKTALSS